MADLYVKYILPVCRILLVVSYGFALLSATASSAQNARPTIGARPGDSGGASAIARPQLALSGKLTVGHPNPGEKVILRVGGVTHTGASGPLSNDELLRMMRVKATRVEDPDEPTTVEDLDEPHNITWTFRSGTEGFVFLGAEETLSLQYTITGTDTDGARGQSVVSVVIRGVNTPPTIVEIDSALSGSVTEFADTSGSDAPNFVFGSIKFKDANRADRHTVAVSLPPNPVRWSEPGAIPQSSLSALVGALKTPVRAEDSGEGIVDWRFEVPDRLLDFIARGEEVSVAYRITIDDGHGGKIATGLTITITGSNDGPQARDDYRSLTAGETISSVLTANDQDSDQNDSTYFIVKRCKSEATGSSAGPTANGTATVVGTFGHLNVERKGKAAYETRASSFSIPGGATGTDKFTCTIDDQHGGPESTSRLTVDITGKPRPHVVTFDDGRGTAIRQDPTNANSVMIGWEEDNIVVMKLEGTGLSLTPEARGRSLSMGIPGTGPLPLTTKKATVCRKDNNGFDLTSIWLSKPDRDDFKIANELVVGLFDLIPGRPQTAVVPFGKQNLPCFTIEQVGAGHMRVNDITIYY